MRASAISEEDLEAVRTEAAQRVAAAERKVYALSKERDALRRGSDKLTSATDLLKEKDDIIQQVGLRSLSLTSSWSFAFQSSEG